MKTVKDFIRKKRTVKIFLSKMNHSYLSFRVETQKDIDDFMSNFAEIVNLKIKLSNEDKQITYLWLGAQNDNN